jgi:hypothetical protein
MSPVELTNGREGLGRGGGGGREKLYDGEKAWPSINRSILTGYKFVRFEQFLKKTLFSL